MKNAFILSLIVFSIANLFAQNDTNYVDPKYVNSYNFLVINSQTYCERWVRNEIDIVYFKDGQYYCKSIVRGSGKNEEMDTIIKLNYEKMKLVSDFINKVRDKRTLRDSTQVLYATTWTEFSVLIPNYGGVVYSDKKKLEPIDKIKFEFIDKSDFSLYNKLINN